MARGVHTIRAHKYARANEPGGRGVHTQEEQRTREAEECTHLGKCGSGVHTQEAKKLSSETKAHPKPKCRHSTARGGQIE